jgi:hypothetical protein
MFISRRFSFTEWVDSVFFRRNDYTFWIISNVSQLIVTFSAEITYLSSKVDYFLIKHNPLALQINIFS